jgi:hypothetical protein
MDNKPKNALGGRLTDVVLSALTSENIQSYVLGTKKNGKPRSIYDIMSKSSLKKKKKKKKADDAYSLYRQVKKGKKKKKKKNTKHWKFD